MTESILQASGLPYWEGWTPSPPAGSYALYLDDVTTDGPDDGPMLLRHDVTVELYEPVADAAAEAALEAAITARGLQWSKQARYWLRDVQLYQAIYEFQYTEKARF